MKNMTFKTKNIYRPGGIIFLMALLLGCSTSKLATTSETDDLYFSAADKDKLVIQKQKEQIARLEREAAERANSNTVTKTESYTYSDNTNSYDQNPDYSTSSSNGGDTYINNYYGNTFGSYRSTWNNPYYYGYNNYGWGGSGVSISFGYSTGWGWNNYYGYNSFYNPYHVNWGWVYDPFFGWSYASYYTQVVAYYNYGYPSYYGWGNNGYAYNNNYYNEPLGYKTKNKNYGPRTTGGSSTGNITSNGLNGKVLYGSNASINPDARPRGQRTDYNSTTTTDNPTTPANSNQTNYARPRGSSGNTNTNTNTTTNSTTNNPTNTTPRMRDNNTYSTPSNNSTYSKPNNSNNNSTPSRNSGSTNSTPRPDNSGNSNMGGGTKTTTTKPRLR